MQRHGADAQRLMMEEADDGAEGGILQPDRAGEQDQQQQQQQQDMGHQLWLRARQQLHDFELKLAEVRVELAQENKGCQQHKETIARALKEMSQIKSARAECSNATTAMYVQVQALHTECELERRSLEQLSHLLNITRQKLDVARAQMQVDRETRRAHALEQAAFIDKTRGILAALQGAAPQQGRPSGAAAAEGPAAAGATTGTAAAP